PITIPTSMLQQGDNLLAVEVHQNATNSGDVVMGMRVDATLPPPDDITAPLTKLFDGLRVTEIMYNPLGGNQYEYIELQNTSAQSLDLTGVRLSEAVDFTFPSMSLAAGARTVVVANVAAFQSRYGNAISVAGQFTGDLGNGGEDVVLQLPAPYD